VPQDHVECNGRAAKESNSLLSQEFNELFSTYNTANTAEKVYKNLLEIK